ISTCHPSSLHDALPIFFSCVRSRKQPNAPAELGYQIITAIKLGVYSYREGKTKLFDPKTQRVIEKGASRPEYQGDGKNHTVQERSEEHTSELQSRENLV